jgi:O-antigen/teichoic acid export membrane protein
MMLRAGYNVFCQINMSDFLKSFVFFGLAISIEKIISFFLLPLYTSYFNTYEYGLIDLIQVTISVISIFSLLQLETSLQRYYFEYEGEEKKRMLSTILISIVFLTLFLTTILILFSKQISLILFETTQYNNLIQLASFQLVFSNFTMIGFLILRYEKKNYTFLILMSIKVIISLILTILFVVVFKMGISGVFKSQLIAFAISSILLFIAVKE